MAVQRGAGGQRQLDDDDGITCCQRIEGRAPPRVVRDTGHFIAEVLHREPDPADAAGTARTDRGDIPGWPYFRTRTVEADDQAKLANVASEHSQTAPQHHDADSQRH
jgi:hypothetical protein